MICFTDEHIVTSINPPRVPGGDASWGCGELLLDVPGIVAGDHGDPRVRILGRGVGRGDLVL